MQHLKIKPITSWIKGNTLSFDQITLTNGNYNLQTGEMSVSYFLSNSDSGKSIRANNMFAPSGMVGIPASVTAQWVDDSVIINYCLSKLNLELATD